MKLYYSPLSAPSRKVRIVASLLGITLDAEELDVTAGAGRTAEFRRLNPNGKVPTLIDQDFVLWESNAIVLYLAGKVPGSTLYPDDLRARADIARWQFWHANHLGPALSAFIFENMFKRFFNLGDPDPAALAKAQPDFDSYASVLEAHLDGRTWLLGDTLTIADITNAASLMYAEAASVPLAPYPHIRRWFDQLQALPAWAETAPPPGLGLR